jgi:hypothetical protein
VSGHPLVGSVMHTSTDVHRLHGRWATCLLESLCFETLDFQRNWVNGAVGWDCPPAALMAPPLWSPARTSSMPSTHHTPVSGCVDTMISSPLAERCCKVCWRVVVAVLIPIHPLHDSCQGRMQELRDSHMCCHQTGVSAVDEGWRCGAQSDRCQPPGAHCSLSCVLSRSFHIASEHDHDGSGQTQTSGVLWNCRCCTTPTGILLRTIRCGVDSLSVQPSSSVNYLRKVLFETRSGGGQLRCCRQWRAFGVMASRSPAPSIAF